MLINDYLFHKLLNRVMALTKPCAHLLKGKYVYQGSLQILFPHLHLSIQSYLNRTLSIKLKVLLMSAQHFQYLQGCVLSCFFFFFNLNKAWPLTFQLILSVQKQKQIISCHHFSLIVHSYCFPEYLSSMPSVDGSLLNNNTLLPEISPAVIVIS